MRDLRAWPSIALLLASADLAVMSAANRHLVGRGNWRLMALLFVSHAVFWLVFLGAIAPLVARFGLRGSRRREGAATAPLWVAAAAGWTGALVVSLVYLRSPLSLLSPKHLAINTLMLGALVVSATLAARRWPGLAGASDRLSAVSLPLGLVAAAGLLGTTLLASRPATLDLEDLRSERAPEDPGAMRTGHGLKVRVVGLDGADWSRIDRYIEEGALPAFAELRASGYTAALESVSPYSPVDWTTIATGMSPGEHSVQYFSEMYAPGLDLTIQKLQFNFLEPLFYRLTSKIPVSSTTRTAPALWEILSAFGGSSVVVNWWASFPAEPQRGVMISNYALPWDEVSAERLASMGPARERVHPESIWPDVVRVMQANAPAERLPFTKEGDDESRATNVAFWDARDRFALALHERFDAPEHALSALYLQGIDTTSHRYSEVVFGPSRDEVRPPRVGPEEIARQEERLKATYMRMDAIVGRRMEQILPGEILVIVSDHGWKFDGTSHWHAPDAIFALYGPSIVPGRQAERGHLFDVAPTLLWALGLPVADDMRGRVRYEAFDPALVAGHPRLSLPTYGLRVPGIRTTEAGIDVEYRRKLRTLGYLE